MAHILRDCFLENNIAVELWDVDKADEADILHSIGTADAVLVGRLDQICGYDRKIGDPAAKMQKMDLAGKLGAAFGSYGWSGEAIEVVQDYLNQTNLTVQSTSSVIKSTGMTHVEFPVRVRFSPQEEDKIKKIRNAAEFISDLLLSAV